MEKVLEMMMMNLYLTGISVSTFRQLLNHQPSQPNFHFSDIDF